MRVCEKNPFEPFDANVLQFFPPVTVARVDHQRRVAVHNDVGTARSSNLEDVVDNAVDSEEECFAAIRRFLSFMPQNVYELPQVLPCDDPVDLPCNEADLAEPFGTLDFSDVIEFLTAFAAMDADADLAPPFGVWDFSDVIEFLTIFGGGCP